MSKAQNISEKLDKLSKKFEVASETAEEIVQASEEVEEIASEVIKEKQQYRPEDIMTLELMADDFKFSRETLKQSIKFAKAVLEKTTQDLLLTEKGRAGDTTAFAELTTALLNGIKVHSQLYKDFSNVLLNIKNIQKADKENINVTNNLNVENTETISTVDLIEKLRLNKT